MGWQLHERPQCQQQLGPSREQVSNFETMAVYYCYYFIIKKSFDCTGGCSSVWDFATIQLFSSVISIMMKSKIVLKLFKIVLKSTFFEITFPLSRITFWFIFYLNENSLASGKTSKMGSIFGVLISDFFLAVLDDPLELFKK